MGAYGEQGRGMQAAAASFPEFDIASHWAWSHGHSGGRLSVRMAHVPSLLDLSRPQRRKAQSALARTLLAQTLNQPVQSLQVLHDELGAPYLTAPPDGSSSLHAISLAHSSAYAACAVAETVADALVAPHAGVDVELQQNRDWGALLPVILHPAEADRLAALADAQRDAEALKLWCCKEALLKAVGRGVQEMTDLAKLHVSRDQVLLLAPDVFGDVAGWSLESHTPAAGLSVAFAWRFA